MKLRPLRSEADYRTALDEVSRLMTARPGTDAFDRLEVLGMLVERYEAERYPMRLPEPAAAIKFHMDRLGLRRKDLEPLIGSRGRVSEVLSGKRPLTLAMIRRLAFGLGIPADSLIGEPRRPKRHAA